MPSSGWIGPTEKLIVGLVILSFLAYLQNVGQYCVVSNRSASARQKDAESQATMGRRAFPRGENEANPQRMSSVDVGSSRESILGELRNLTSVLGSWTEDGEAAKLADVARELQRLAEIVQSQSESGEVQGQADSAAAAKPRKRIRAFIGVFTGFSKPDAEERYDYTLRRKAMRDTWFPESTAALERMEKEKGVVIRFITGHSDDPELERLLGEEAEKHGDFMRLELTESYRGLPYKTRDLFVTAAAGYDADYYVKMDDDVYLMVPRLLLAMQQWDAMGADYIGCMKRGQVIRDPQHRWYEPLHLLLGGEYYLHAYGSIYVLSRRTVQEVVVHNAQQGLLRMLGNEDVTVGSWMLGHNITHFEDMRLCSPSCRYAAVGILSNKCAGLCDPVHDLYKVHNSPRCHSNNHDPLPYLPSYPEHRDFEAMRV